MTTETLSNGVNATAVGDFAQQLQTDAPAAGTPFYAAVHWRGGFRNEILVRDLPPTYADEPKILGGTDTAANPVEQVLGALGACLAIGYTAGAVARGITIDELRVDLEGNIDLPVFFGLADGHAGYERVDARVYLRSDASAAAIEALHADVIRTSPVGNTLERPAARAVRGTTTPCLLVRRRPGWTSGSRIIASSLRSCSNRAGCALTDDRPDRRGQCVGVRACPVGLAARGSERR